MPHSISKFPRPIVARSFRLRVLAALLLLPAASAFAANDRASFGHDITVADGETASDIACAFCSVYLHGDVHGDVAVLFGSVTLDSGHRVSGDVAILGGDVTLADDSSIGGDLSIAGGEVEMASNATVRGGRTVFPRKLLLVMPLALLLVLAILIWLIVYVVRRNRYQFPAYPNGRGF